MNIDQIIVFNNFAFVFFWHIVRKSKQLIKYTLTRLLTHFNYFNSNDYESWMCLMWSFQRSYTSLSRIEL